MRNPFKIFFTLICIVFSNTTHADNMLVDTNIFYTIPDAGGTDDFQTGKLININYNYYALDWLAITAGLFTSENISDKTTTDIVGTYQVIIQTQGLTLELRPEYAFSKRNKIYGRTGLVFYETKVTVDEYFAPGLPSGSTSNTADGKGYSLALGWSHSFTQKFSFQLEIKSQQQLDLFDGKTSPDKIFDLNFTGISLGLGYAF